MSSSFKETLIFLKIIYKLYLAIVMSYMVTPQIAGVINFVLKFNSYLNELPGF